MRLHAALAVRLDVPPRAPVIDEEAADLSTFSRRPAGVHIDALSIAPRVERWTSLAGPVPGRLAGGGLPGDQGRSSRGNAGRTGTGGEGGEGGEGMEGMGVLTVDEGVRVRRARPGVGPA